MRLALPCLLLTACLPSTDDLLEDVDVTAADLGALPEGTVAAWELDTTAEPRLAFEATGLLGIGAAGTWSSYNVRVAALGDTPSTWQVRFLADMDSVETGNGRLNEHIRTTDFLDVTGHPDGRFTSTAIRPLDGDRYEVSGDMTLRGTTKPLTYEATIREEGDAVRSTATIAFSRWDFGLYADDVAEPGGDGASDAVTVTYDVRLSAIALP